MRFPILKIGVLSSRCSPAGTSDAGLAAHGLPVPSINLRMPEPRGWACLVGLTKIIEP